MRAVLIVVALSIAAPQHAIAKEDPRRAAAKEHYEKGLAHFHLQEYPASIEEFQEAYRLRPDPVFLYNLGQAYRLADNPERALYFYRDFLRSADNPPNRSEVEGRILDLERAIEARKKQLNAPPDQTMAPRESTPEPPAAAQPRRQPLVTATTGNEIGQSAQHDRKPVYRRWWFWTALGGVVVAGAVVATVVVVTSSGSKFDANVGTFGPKALAVSW